MGMPSPRRIAGPVLFSMLSIAACRSNEPSQAEAELAAQVDTAADPVARGAYLVRFGACGDCHTPKVMTPQGPVEDTTRMLSGHPAGSTLPPIPSGVVGPDGWDGLAGAGLTAWAGPWGVSFTANLTPDATGLAAWTEDQFVQTMRNGKRMGVGRPLLPPMPWYYIGTLTDEDLRAVFAYLRSLRPVRNAVPAPIPPSGPVASR